MPLARWTGSGEVAARQADESVSEAPDPGDATAI